MSTPLTPLSPKPTDHQLWLTILRGWAVLLVIMMHSTFVYEDNVVGEVASVFIRIFSFRMPLFFFISGYLLYYTKLKKSSSYLSTLKDRLPRIGYPYFFITLICVFIKIILNNYVQRPIELSPGNFLAYFLYPQQNPYYVLWFLNVILIFFLCYPLFQLALKNRYTRIFFWVGFAVIHFIMPEDILWLDLSRVGHYLIYFYSGVLFSFYQPQPYGTSRWIPATLLPVFILLSLYDAPGILHALCGIALSVWFSIALSRSHPDLFSSFRYYYYQIYLFGGLFQGAFIIFNQQIMSSALSVILLCGIASLLVGLYLPIYLTQCILWFNWPPLRKIAGLK